MHVRSPWGVGCRRPVAARRMGNSEHAATALPTLVASTRAEAMSGPVALPAWVGCSVWYRARSLQWSRRMQRSVGWSDYRATARRRHRPIAAIAAIAAGHGDKACGAGMQAAAGARRSAITRTGPAGHGAARLITAGQASGLGGALRVGSTAAHCHGNARCRAVVQVSSCLRPRRPRRVGHARR